jgi:hypothetical protein
MRSAVHLIVATQLAACATALPDEDELDPGLASGAAQNFCEFRWNTAYGALQQAFSHSSDEHQVLALLSNELTSRLPALQLSRDLSIQARRTADDRRSWTLVATVAGGKLKFQLDSDVLPADCLLDFVICTDRSIMASLVAVTLERHSDVAGDLAVDPCHAASAPGTSYTVANPVPGWLWQKQDSSPE